MIPKIALEFFPLPAGGTGFSGLGGGGHASGTGSGVSGSGFSPGQIPGREKTPSFTHVQRIGDLLSPKKNPQAPQQTLAQRDASQRLTQEADRRISTFGQRFTNPRGVGSNTSPLAFFGMGAIEGRYQQG